MSGDIHFGMDVTADNLREFEAALREMQAQAVMAGFPADKNEEREDENGNPTPITNAALGYIHDKGMPEQNIPARPFMVPGIESVEGKIVDGMERIGVAALDGDTQEVEAGFMAVGLTAQNGIRRKIIDGPFAPLADSTLVARARMGGRIAKAAQAEIDSRAAGNEAGVDNARPLNLTGQMRNAVTYVIRKEGEGDAAG
jgi:hypothetical protein